jgi:hypothetical protein
MRERTSICAAGPVAMPRGPVGIKCLASATSDANTWLIISPLHGGVYTLRREENLFVRPDRQFVA